MLPLPPVPAPRLRPPAPPPSRQLPLPLDGLPGPAPPALPPRLASRSARRVWTTLGPAARQEVRRTVLHVLQEVLARADHPAHDAEPRRR
jgi:hypothetical protein